MEIGYAEAPFYMCGLIASAVRKFCVCLACSWESLQLISMTRIAQNGRVSATDFICWLM